MINSVRLHLVFGILTGVCLAFFVTALVQRQQATAYNRAILEADASQSGAQGMAGRLAHGIQLSAKRDADGARKAFQAVIQDGPFELQQLARYNLANLHLREAMQTGPATAEAQPLIESAKQQYREVLAAAPYQWNARYNLERALWLAPEIETLSTGQNASGPRTRVVTAVKIEPGELP